MFIDDVIKYIWKDESIKYQIAVDKYQKWDVEELYRRLKEQKMSIIKYRGVTMNSLATCGCRYRFKGKHISGCSMCNYQSKFTEFQGAMAVLREKRPDLYSKVVKKSFENVRGVKPDPDLYEIITGYNFFDEIEFPEEVYKEFFGDGNIFSSKPYKYIFEVRASDVTEEKVARLRSCLPKRSRVLIEFGVEVLDEWIRNRWLNKGASNRDIIRAVNAIHNHGCKASGDVIFGIPGLTEKQSMDLFENTLLWLDNLGFDEIICLPLNRKERTLQGFLYEELRHNEVLYNKGLVNEEHTGLNWIYSLIESLIRVCTTNPSIAKKINFAQLGDSTNVIENTVFYNSEIHCKCREEGIKALAEFHTTKNVEILLDYHQKREDHTCYKDYKALLKRQNANTSLKESFELLAKEIGKVVWDDKWIEAYKMFEAELEGYEQ